MSTLKVTNLQHPSALSANVTLDSDGSGISGVASVNGSQLGGYKNLIQNGNFSVSQRGSSFTTDNVYTLDRWYSSDGTGGSPARTFSQETFTLGQTDVPGAYYYARHDQTGASTNGNSALLQRIEDVTRFDGQTVTLSFYAKADVSMDVELLFAQIFGTGGSPSATVTLSETVTIGTSWTRYTVTKTLGSLSGKTLGTDGVHTSCFRVQFVFQPTSTFTFDIALVQLEYGSTASDFEQESYGTTLQKVQRYYFRHKADGANDPILGTASNWGASNAYAYIQFPVQMRDTPSGSYSALTDFTYYIAGGTKTPTAMGLSTRATNYAAEWDINSSGLTAGQAGWMRSANGSAYIEYDAEV